MADPEAFWSWCTAALRRGQALRLLLVVDSRGSSPRKAGAKMACCGDGTHCGSIGGGELEQSLIQHARQMPDTGAGTPQLFRERHPPDAPYDTSVVSCGGEQTVLLYPCAVQDLPLIERLARCCSERREIGLSIGPSGLELYPAAASDIDFVYVSERAWRYREGLGARNQAYIVGGGHVSLALSQILALLEFDITVIDSRPDLDTLRDNVYARRKLLCRYEELAAVVPEGARHFVFVMTHSHRCDVLAVAQLAPKRLGYLGVLGSRNKIARLKAALAPLLNQDRLQTLHAPAGLPIGSHTPAEIAVSIGAEVVQLLNRKQHTEQSGAENAPESHEKG